MTSPLYQKRLALDGDSICQGAGHSGGYGKIIAERNNMSFENIGVGGGTVTAETYYDDGQKRHWRRSERRFPGRAAWPHDRWLLRPT